MLACLMVVMLVAGFLLFAVRWWIELAHAVAGVDIPSFHAAQRLEEERKLLAVRETIAKLEAQLREAEAARGRDTQQIAELEEKAGQFASLTQERDSLQKRVDFLEHEYAPDVARDNAPPRDHWIAKASGTRQTDPPQGAIDGSRRWSTGGRQQGGEWYQIDFGKTERISAIRFGPGKHENDYPRAYEIRVSLKDEDLNGTLVASGRGRKDVDVRETFEPVRGRYLLIKQTGTVGEKENYYWSITHIDVLFDSGSSQGTEGNHEVSSQA